MNFWTEQTSFRKYRSFQLIQSGMKIAGSIPRLDLNIENSLDFVSLAERQISIWSPITVPQPAGPILTSHGALASPSALPSLTTYDPYQRYWHLQHQLCLNSQYYTCLPACLSTISTAQITQLTAIKINRSNIRAVTLWHCHTLTVV